MSTDLEQFYEVFFEESAELLAEMETCLLRLDVNSPDLEDMNAIFRAAHSIKGGAGTFGFMDMMEMTHMLESLLDKLRKGEIEVKSEMIDSFLRAGDVIRGQLAGHRGDGEADPADAAVVCEELKRFSETISESAVGSVAPTPVESNIELATAEPESVVALDPAGTAFSIEFPGEGVTSKVMDNLLDNLEDMGSLERISEVVDGVHCRLRLVTESSEEDIWEILAFVVDPSELKIVAETAGKQAVPVDNALEVKSSVADESLAELDTATASDDSNQEQETSLSQQQPYGFFPGAPAAPADVTEDDSMGAESQSASNNTKPAKVEKKSGKPASTSSESSSIRVSIEKVDQMINLVGELVITRAMLAQAVSMVDPVICEKLLGGMSQLEHNTRDLQEAVMSIRMLPISFVFSRYPRVVRDLAMKLNKQVELKTVGESTELDKGLIEKITDPLNHLVRNSLDHGIELPDKRLAAGKPAKGTVTLRAFHQGGSIVIEVSDDGAGLSRDRILSVARTRGLSVHDGMADQEVWMLIFDAGFSTAAVVTDVSGRGVGMDVVKRNIQAMGGRIEIDSVFGVGTRISIRLPLTLAILDGLSVSVGDQMFIVPISHITESFQAQPGDVKTVSGSGQVVHVRGEYLPVIALHEIFNIRPKTSDIDKGILVILESEGGKVAMFVDALIGQHQVVIKSLENNYRRVQGVSGATIMGDGKVALILDVDGLVTASK